MIVPSDREAAALDAVLAFNAGTGAGAEEAEAAEEARGGGSREEEE